MMFLFGGLEKRIFFCKNKQEYPPIPQFNQLTPTHCIFHRYYSQIAGIIKDNTLKDL